VVLSYDKKIKKNPVGKELVVHGEGLWNYGITELRRAEG